MRQFPDHGPSPRRSAPLRVSLFVHAFYPDHVYGTESYTLTLARQLRALGHHCVVVTARAPHEARQGAEVETFEVEGVPVVRIDRNWSPPRSAGDAYHQPSLEPLLTRILQQLAPDVVHICHLDNFTAVLPEVTARLKIPTFATLTDFFNLCLTGTMETTNGGLCRGPDRRRMNCMECGLSLRAAERPSLWWRAVAHPLFRPVAAAFAVRLPFLLPPAVARDAGAVVRRPDMLQRAMASYRAAIAPSGFLKDVFSANGVTTPLVRSAFGVDIDRRAKPRRAAVPVRFGFIGQLVYHKGPHLLLQALRTLPPDSFTLDVWGSEQLLPGYARDLRAVAASMPVAFRGTFDEQQMAAILADIDVLVLPSTWFENSPLTLLKALATHTPVIVSDVPGMTEFVAEGIDGFAFPRGDVAALGAALRRFTDAPGLAAEMSARTAYDRTERDMAMDVLALYARYGAVSRRAGARGPGR